MGSNRLMMILADAAWHEIYRSWLQAFGKNAVLTSFLYNGSIILITVILGVLSYKFGKWLVSTIGKRIAQNSTFAILRLAANNKFYIYLSLFFPLVVAYYSLSILTRENEKGYALLEKGYVIVVILIIVFLINSILKTIIDLNKRLRKTHSEPIKGLIQFLQILIYFFAIIVCVSIVFTNSPWKLIGGLGAVSAVLMLIFKDSILGLVGGVQLSFNKTLEIGDSISLPEYHADGEVIDITLTSIKIRNWDNSISVVPSYNLVVTNAIKNWRNLSDLAPRRISSFIPLDMNSIVFCTPEMLEAFGKMDELQDYIKKNKPDSTENTSSLTNLEFYRAYIYAYLNKRPDVKSDMDIIVKQDEPTYNGLPIGIYCFLDTTDAKEYERIRTTILAHMIAKLSEFNLKTCQIATS